MKCNVIKAVQTSIPPLTSDSQFLYVPEGHYPSSGSKRMADKYSTYFVLIGDIRRPRIFKRISDGSIYGGKRSILL